MDRSSKPKYGRKSPGTGSHSLPTREEAESQLILTGKTTNPNVAAMRQRKNESEVEFWERQIAADGVIHINDNTHIWLDLKGNIHKIYPPLSDAAKIAVRALADEYWRLVDEAHAAGREFGRRRGSDRRRRQVRIDFPDRRSGNDRRQDNKK